jgi:hypothetical protein
MNSSMVIHRKIPLDFILMLFKADGLVEKQTVEGFIMQIFSHIEVQLLLNDNNVCYVVNHVYVGGWASNKIKWYFPMNYHAWVHCELGKLRQEPIL